MSSVRSFCRDGDEQHSATARHVNIAIIGGGCSGLAAAIRFDQAGHDDFLVFERGSDVGGTCATTLIGEACDLPSTIDRPAAVGPLAGETAQREIAVAVRAHGYRPAAAMTHPLPPRSTMPCADRPRLLPGPCRIGSSSTPTPISSDSIPLESRQCAPTFGTADLSSATPRRGGGDRAG